MQEAIEVVDLEKSFSNHKVLDKISFRVPSGSIFALLGTNGSGKTTTVKMMTTLLKPDHGSVKIDNLDISQQALAIQKRFSLTGQFAAVDEVLTGRENLVLIAKLRHLKNYLSKVDELLAVFDLQEAADRPAQTYSGGMRRKLDLAMSLIDPPQILFLDEPTTGLDPQARAVLWQMIRTLKKSGVTIFLTTQYLEEAEQLADTVAILNRGKIALQGSVAEVKRHLPKETLELTFADEETLAAAETLIGGKVNKELLALNVATENKVEKITMILNQLQAAKLEILTFTQKRASLDDVFFMIVENRTEEGK
ncbi:ATP-binding cassette domain-containing protein [Enterococcus hulanensis]|uniref:ATP-binding cassette domain-containing protein n=1 Tax=Enterococcus hulanensis TaxID=2559929 RepID=A0ABU3EZ75_9ENTE|nr:ATP-binding cassette domain-containing protein [Enterococcus hulanensis]MDT2600178.1 ATP-binding cassette domain-containing protein [Enterococcus hulanensis]MDT2608991.1 ATP-binding cassette domain-containing protein [Enterococcus hulanensis]MDT2616967.1 ATP-binding cassette domain-containing protein [Enterococcus hulanensis]MDT2628513.1 ATP-binding cassette domain-containing protein [Enterococcus hulanensis]MDT2655853.1 ATP-binding cassette domain-containing protein [Enterococcus hulanensi